jgi:1,2-beta-oligoglucan phosphorylase
MYTHAHLRYAEALARVGDAPGLLRALCQVNPIGVTTRIASARPRQSTCYYSSSDAAFVDREDAERRYPDSLTGEVPLEGGWRVYSSGPGLFLRLVVECLLGVSRRGDDLVLDPVLDPELDGLTARVPIAGRLLDLQYQVRTPGYGVPSVSVAGRDLPLQPMRNRYRSAGARLPLAGLGPPDDSEIPVVVRVGDE